MSVPSKPFIIFISAFIIAVLMGLPNLIITTQFFEGAITSAQRYRLSIHFLNLFVMALIFLSINFSERQLYLGPVPLDLKKTRIRVILNMVLFVIIQLTIIAVILRNLPPAYERFLGKGFGLFMISNNLILLVSTFLIASTYRHMTRHQKVVLHNEKLLKQHAEARYETLKNQINPHFLFNAFYTLQGLVDDTPQQAKTFIANMSDVFRYVLQSAEHDTVSLKKELEFTESYLAILNSRFGKALEIRQFVAPEALTRQVPPLSLQILLENATKHNHFSKAFPLLIVIRTEACSITVSNNLQPRKVAPENSASIGLYNLNQRYRFLSDQEISVKNSPNHFSVTLPLLS